jgi:hypothetical protein
MKDEMWTYSNGRSKVGIFFTSTQPVLPALKTALEDALRVAPTTLLDPGLEASNRTVQLAQTVAPKFNAFRFGGAVAISGALVWGAVWTGQHDLSDISKDLMNSFAGFSGIVVGLLGGEAQKSPSG